MARPGLSQHTKFLRLVRLLKCPRSHARGYLELLWESAYACASPRIGDDTDVELAADWPGSPGVLAAALAAAGGENRAGFIEQVDGEWHVHDLLENAPEYVTIRCNREDERRKLKVCEHCGGEFRSPEARAKFCTSACRVAAFKSRKRAQDSEPDEGNALVTEGNGGKRRVTEGSVSVTEGNGPPPPFLNGGGGGKSEQDDVAWLLIAAELSGVGMADCHVRPIDGRVTPDEVHKIIAYWSERRDRMDAKDLLGVLHNRIRNYVHGSNPKRGWPCAKKKPLGDHRLPGDNGAKPL